MKKNRWHSQNFLESLKYALEGIDYAASTQRNVKIHFIITIIVLFFSLFFDLSNTEFLFIILSISFVIFSEFINTSIEAAVDLCTEEYNLKAKIAKDVAAGAVVVASVNAVVVGLVIFGEKLLEKGFGAISFSNISIIQTLISLLICTFIISIFIRTCIKNKKDKRRDVDGKKRKKEKK